MTDYQEPPRVVFDCMIYLQATANDKGVSGKCLRLFDEDSITLFISEQILNEIKAVLNRPFIREKNPRITDVEVDALFKRLERKAIQIVNVPEEFRYLRDPKDEPYINLALIAHAEYLVTLDKDLLDLIDESKSAAKEFRFKYPFLKILTPMSFLSEIEKTH